MKLSYSSLNDFSVCKRKYYFSKLENLEASHFNINFFMGKVIQEGIHAILRKDKQPMEHAQEAFDKELKETRKAYVLDIRAEQDIVEAQVILEGIVKAYASYYAHFLKSVRLVDNEREINYQIDNENALVGYLDNVIKIGKKYYLHELKTTSYLTPQYVQAVQTNFQIALYYHIHNEIYDPALSGIVFDVIRKPSISQTKKESPQQFLTRLGEYYESKSYPENFYQEIIEIPLVKRDMLFNTLEKMSVDISSCKSVEDYYQEFPACNVLGKCTYHDLCYAGLTVKNALRMNYFRQKTNRRLTKKGKK